MDDKTGAFIWSYSCDFEASGCLKARTWVQLVSRVDPMQFAKYQESHKMQYNLSLRQLDFARYLHARL